MSYKNNKRSKGLTKVNISTFYQSSLRSKFCTLVLQILSMTSCQKSYICLLSCYDKMINIVYVMYVFELRLGLFIETGVEKSGQFIVFIV